MNAASPLPEPRSHTGCPTCTTARCCVVFDPELTGHDVLRLLALGLEAHDFTTLRPTRIDQAGPDGLLDEEGCAWDLRLARTGSPELRPTAPDPRDDARRCGFLVTLGGASRCGVYTHRPMTCRTFPSARTSFGVIVATPEAICPPGAFAQERADLPALIALHHIAEREREAFRVFAAQWNAQAPAHRALSRLRLALVRFTRELDLAEHSRWPALARVALTPTEPTPP